MSGVDLTVKPALVPPRVTVILFAEYENCSVLTAFDPSVLVQLSDERLARLIPVRVHGRERIVAPQVRRWLLGELLFQAVLRVPHHQPRAVGDV